MGFCLAAVGRLLIVGASLIVQLVKNPPTMQETWVVLLGFPGGSIGKESACNAGDLGSIPGLGRSPGREHGNLLQCFCLENSMDRGARRAIVHGVLKSRT